ncbi:MAG: hypothetical protein J5897_04875, partial [Candidatus Methanomethylophilus sp.]|nr:hypothetical protein [Methanomethylophilus sp.]
MFPDYTLTKSVLTTHLTQYYIIEQKEKGDVDPPCEGFVSLELSVVDAGPDIGLEDLCILAV